LILGKSLTLLPPDVIFKSDNAPKSISTGALSQTLLGELTALPQTPSLKGPTSKTGEKGLGKEGEGGREGRGEEGGKGEKGREGRGDPHFYGEGYATATRSIYVKSLCRFFARGL